MAAESCLSITLSISVIDDLCKSIIGDTLSLTEERSICCERDLRPEICVVSFSILVVVLLIRPSGIFKGKTIWEIMKMLFMLT